MGACGNLNLHAVLNSNYVRTSLSTYSITSRNFSILSYLDIDASDQGEAIVFKRLASLPSCHGRQVGIIVGGRALAARGPGFDSQQRHLSFVPCSNIVISKATNSGGF